MNTTEREREILHAHPHEQELAHHWHANRMPAIEHMLIGVAVLAVALVLALIIAIG